MRIIVCRQACYKTCLQYFIVKTCGCGDSLYPLNATAFGGTQRVCDITNSTEGKSVLSLYRSYFQARGDSCLPLLLSNRWTNFPRAPSWERNRGLEKG